MGFPFPYARMHSARLHFSGMYTQSLLRKAGCPQHIQQAGPPGVSAGSGRQGLRFLAYAFLTVKRKKSKQAECLHGKIQRCHGTLSEEIYQIIDTDKGKRQQDYVFKEPRHKNILLYCWFYYIANCIKCQYR